MGGKGSKNKPVKKPNPPTTTDGGQGNPAAKPQDNGDDADRVDHIFKICIIGDANVGKTSILLRFVEDKFTENEKVKTNEEFLEKIIEHKGDKVKLIIWDTRGQENFRQITGGDLRGSHGAFIVYDVTNNPTFNSATTEWNELLNKSCMGVSKILVGNKTDLELKVVSAEIAKDWAVKNKTEFIETSAKSNSNIEAAFRQLIDRILLDDNS